MQWMVPKSVDEALLVFRSLSINYSWVQCVALSEQDELGGREMKTIHKMVT